MLIPKNLTIHHMLYGLAIVIVLLLLSPFLFAMTRLFPEADDYIRAGMAYGLFDLSGGLANLKDAWLNSSGRFTHHFLVVFLGDAAMSRLAYGIVCLSLQGITAMALYGIFSTLSRPEHRGTSLFLALFCLLALQCGHTAYDLTYTLLTDVLGIAIGNSLVLVHIFLLCRLWFCRSAHVPLLVGLTIFTALLTAGCYEHAALGMGTASATALILALLYRHPSRPAYMLVLAGSLVALCCTFLAPGNFIRRSAFLREGNLLLFTVSQWMQHGLGMYSIVYLTMALTVAVLLQPRWHESLGSRYGLAPILGAGIAGIGFFSFSICLLHSVGGYRLEWASKLSASIGLLGAYGLVFLVLSIRDSLQKIFARLLWPLTPVIALVIVCTSPNMRAVSTNVLGGNVENYVVQQQRQHAFLSKGMGDDIAVSQLEFIPFPMWSFREINIPHERPETWPNGSIAALYGYKSVVRLPLSATYAYNAAKARLTSFTQQPQLPSPLTRSLIILNLFGNSGDTFCRDWLLLWSRSPLKTIQTVTIEEPGKNRLLFPIFQRALADHFLHMDKTTYSLPLQLAGISKTFDATRWKVANEQYVYMLPVRYSSSKSIQAVFVGWDGILWRISSVQSGSIAARPSL